MDEFMDCLKCDDIMDFVEIIEEDGIKYLKFKCDECGAIAIIKQG